MRYFLNQSSAAGPPAALRVWSSRRVAYCSLALIVYFVCGASIHAQQHKDIPLVEPFLVSGNFRQGRTALEEHLGNQPDDDQARFGLGIVQFMQAVEHLGQSVHRYGVNEEVAGSMPFLRLPVPENTDPEMITYEQARDVLEKMEGYLNEADQTLSSINDSDVRLPLHLFTFRLDFNADGKTDNTENISEMVMKFVGRPANKESTENIVIVFDQADVHWLRGYCCLLRATINVALAHDEEKLWDVVAHRLFKNAEIKFDFLREEREKAREEAGDEDNRRRGLFSFEINELLDFIGAIHNLNFPLTDAARMKRAHALLKETIGHSRKMWASARQESDNDREWIPNADQQCPIVRADITPEMLESWDAFLEESEAILDGRKLLPFWRGTDETRGINLQKVFHQPQDLDIVLWAHGSAAVPYLETGELTEREFWEEMQRSFGGNFFFFASWFN